jgi:hypothetical protein
MAAGEFQAFNPPDRRRLGVLALALSLVVFVVAMAGVAASPVLLGAIYASGRGYSTVGDVGQAYGAASVKISSTTAARAGTQPDSVGRRGHVR